MKARFYLICSVLWMALIWIISSIPGKEIPEISILGIDKLAHFGIYFFWSALLKQYAEARDSKAIESVLILALMMLLASLDEYHQHYIPGRSVSFYDLLANWAGILMAWGILGIRQRWARK